jgi:hypothetical protein
VRELAASFEQLQDSPTKVAPALIQYDANGCASAPLLPGWDPNRYQDAQEAYLLLVNKVEQGLQGTLHEGVLTALTTGFMQCEIRRSCGHHTMLEKSIPFSSIDIGGIGLHTDVSV